MSDDLIEWLLDWGRIGEEPKLIEAAARIKKLEAALRKYADEEYNGYNADGAHARKALEGKDD
jgi:hypothetical protein